MLDHRYVNENLDYVREKLAQRNAQVDWEHFSSLISARSEAIQAFEEKRHEQKVKSAEFGRFARDPEEGPRRRAELKELSELIKELEKRQTEAESQLADFMLYLPNVPHASTPVGGGEEDNVVVRTHGEPGTFAFTPRPHWEVGEELGIIDLETAARVSGSRFVLYRGMGAYLELGLAMFMLDTAREAGYEPVMPPYLVLREAMMGTGQLPKFEDDAFKVDDYFLIPTAEVPVTNMHREAILDEAQLPIRYVAYSSCFRREAGSAGKDTRGITRVHQFQKVELVKFVHPDNSYDELEALTANAETVLQKLELPYRVSALCTGDIGFSAAKCYDIEVWLPGQQVWREISSCSNFEDFQARRANIRFRPDGEKKPKPRFVHTLNGSGLAIGRTILALLENFQQEDGSVVIPPALRPYVGGKEVIRKGEF
jgi:seryl-tRNA synthetase